MLRALTVITALLCLLPALPPGRAQADTTIYTERSLYRNLVVSQDSERRCIRFNPRSKTVQSCFSFKNPDTILFECNRMILGSLYLRPNPRRILMIGLGGGTLASAFSHILPNAEIDVVEIDPAMLRIAKEYFNFRPTPKVRTFVEDGRVYVKRALARGEKYDLVILDAFDDIYIPAHMMTKEFLNEVEQVMSADGVLAANTYCNSKRYDSESATYEAVFGSYFNLKKFWKNTRVIIATKQESLPSEEELKRNARALEKTFLKFGVESSWLLPLFSTDQDWDENARLITDQFVPF